MGCFQLASLVKLRLLSFAGFARKAQEWLLLLRPDSANLCFRDFAAFRLEKKGERSNESKHVVG